MFILGIDPGTAKMGWGVVQITPQKKVKLVESSVLVTSKDLGDEIRLKILYSGINALIRRFSPKTMVIERLFFNTNVKTAITVGQARGVAMLSAANKKLRVYEYTALEAKKLLTGYGRADKKDVQEAVKDLLGLPSIIKSDDGNDAVAMALCYIKKDYDDLI